jgi:hypothetical protein
MIMMMSETTFFVERRVRNDTFFCMKTSPFWYKNSFFVSNPPLSIQKNCFLYPNPPFWYKISCFVSNPPFRYKIKLVFECVIRWGYMTAPVTKVAILYTGTALLFNSLRGTHRQSQILRTGTAFLFTTHTKIPDSVHRDWICVQLFCRTHRTADYLHRDSVFVY